MRHQPKHHRQQRGNEGACHQSEGRTGQKSPVTDQHGEDCNPQRQDPGGHHHGSDHNSSVVGQKAKGGDQTGTHSEHQKGLIQLRVAVVAAVQLIQAITFLKQMLLIVGQLLGIVSSSDQR